MAGDKKNRIALFLVLITFAADLVPTSGHCQNTSSSKKTLIILDPGHGGADSGTTFKDGDQSYSEKDITLKTALQTAKLLREAGVPSVLTRTADLFATLDARTKLANSLASGVPASVFVSLHINADPDPLIRGLESYVLNTATNDAAARLAELENGSPARAPGSAPRPALDLILTELVSVGNFKESFALATSIQGEMIRQLQPHGAKDRGVKQALFYVLLRAQMPALLVELGYASNAQDRKLLTSGKGQRTIAQALSRALTQAIREKDSVSRSFFLDQKNR